MRGLNRVVGLLMTAVLLAAPYSLTAQTASADQYLAAGNKLYAAKSYGQAIQYFNAAIKLNPNNAAAYQVTGNCYYALGNKKYALAYYQRASALQPANTALAQFVQNLTAQVSAGAGGASAAPASPVAADYLGRGAMYFKQRQYAASIPYFRAAIQQNPNDYRGYYYEGYAYYMTGNYKYAAFYFGVANAKQPNASIKAYADRVKSSLPPEGQQWVDDMVAKYSTGGTAMAAGGASKKKDDVEFGLHVRMGADYILDDPSQITGPNGYATKSGSVSLSGLTPNIIPFPEVEPYIQIAKAFEISLAFGYFPVGNLSYTTFDYSRTDPSGGNPDVWNYTYNTNIVTVDLGAKILFGDDQVKGYFGLSGGISPISLNFNKLSMDSADVNKLGTDDSSGDYSTMAVNAKAILGMDISLGKGIALGPYVGFRYLNATNFQKAGAPLVVDTKTGAAGQQGVGVPSIPGSTNIPLSDPVVPLTLDFSGVIGGIDLTFSF